MFKDVWIYISKSKQKDMQHVGYIILIPCQSHLIQTILGMTLWLNSASKSSSWHQKTLQKLDF